MIIDKIDYQGWPNSYRISNGEVELIVTGDIGPRIMRYGFVGGQNLFKEYPDTLGKSGEADWQLRGRGFKHLSAFLWRQVVPDRSLDHPRRNSIDTDEC